MVESNDASNAGAVAADASLKVPFAEQKRQAIDALRGYVYQIYASAIAWTRLVSEETLLLEVAEDYAVVAQGALDASQVKNTDRSANATLRSDGVVKAIDSLWAFQVENPGRRVTVNYLSTSGIGRERGIEFSGGKPGIEHWRDAAREHVSAVQLKEFLATLPLSQDLKDWLSSCGEEEFRERILRRIRWSFGEPQLGSLVQLLDDALIVQGEGLGVTPTDVRQARSSVLNVVLDRVVSPEADARRLTRADLLSTLEAATSISVPRAMLRQVSGGLHVGAPQQIVAPDIMVDVQRIPPPPIAVKRPGFSGELRAGVAAGGVWLYGPTGSGKTSSCVESFKTSNRVWHLVELRGLDPTSVAERLQRARITVSSSEAFGGLILDDFPMEAVATVKLQLALLRDAVALVDGALVLTSAKAPGPTTAAILADAAVLPTPGLSESEVAGLVSAAGGDPDYWSRSIAIISGGHPQLASARVLGLKDRGWPQNEVAAGIMPDQPAIDIDAERAEVRGRLVAELSEPRRTLLYRLSLLMSGFDRQLAMDVAGVEKPVTNPGEALDFLVGPWIEAQGGDRYRLSPLVVGAGQQSLSAAETQAVNEAVCKSLLTRRPFPGDLLTQLFASGLAAKSASALAFLSMLVISAGEQHRSAIMRELSVLQYLKTTEWLFPADKRVSVLLRLSQLHVLLADETKSADTVYRRLLLEIAESPDNTGFGEAATFSYLAKESGSLRPSIWYPELKRLDKSSLTISAESVREVEGASGFPGETIDQFLFLWRTTKLQSISELEELVRLLEEDGPEARAHYFGSLGPGMGFRTMVQIPWVRDAEGAEFDAADSVERYRVIAERTAHWDQKDFAIECIVARASLLAEYLRDTDIALALLDEAGAAWPDESRIKRERTKILFQLGRHEEVIEGSKELLKDADFDPIERVHTLRDLAVSTAKQGDNLASGPLFSRAAEVAASHPVLVDLRAGLLADQAFVEFLSGERLKAFHTLLESVRATDQIDRDAERGGFVIRMIAGLQAWMVTQAGNLGDDPNVGMIVGASSGNPPTEPFPTPVPLKQVLWYQLGTLHQLLKPDISIDDEIDARVNGSRMPIFEATRIFRSVHKVATTGDPAKLIESIITAATAFDFVRSNNDKIDAVELQEVAEKMPWEGEEKIDLSNEVQQQVAIDTTLSFLAYSWLELGKDLRADVKGAFKSDRRTEVLAGLTILGDLEFTSDLGAPESTAAAIKFLASSLEPEPSKLFLATFRLWQWLRVASISDEAFASVAKKIKERWLHIIDNAAFGLRMPMRSVPRIRTALISVATLSEIAAVITAANDAVRPNLSIEALALVSAS